MATIQHRVLVHAPIGTVYEAIATANGISTWWDKQTPRHTDRGLVLEHNPGGEHGIVQPRVVQLIPERRIEWECISAHPATSPASAWTGTHFIFDLERRGAADTEIDFQQTGYDDRSPFLSGNRDAWGKVMQNLKRVVESHLV